MAKKPNIPVGDADLHGQKKSTRTSTRTKNTKKWT